MSLTKDPEEARKMLRNIIIGNGPHFNLHEISRRTGVPKSTLHDWELQMRKTVSSCPTQPPSFQYAPSAGPQMLGQALQPLERLQGSPPVSALSTQPVLGDTHILGQHLMRIRGRHLVVGPQRYPDLLRGRSMLYWETRWPHLILTRSAMLLFFMLSPHVFLSGLSRSI